MREGKYDCMVFTLGEGKWGPSRLEANIRESPKVIWLIGETMRRLAWPQLWEIVLGK